MTASNDMTPGRYDLVFSKEKAKKGFTTAVTNEGNIVFFTDECPAGQGKNDPDNGISVVASNVQYADVSGYAPIPRVPGF